MRMVHKDCQFLYLMRQLPNQDVIFLADAQKPDSEDYAPPGLKYEEISDEYLNVFKRKKSVTVGPISDRWGTLITSLVPVFDDKSNELIAVLGMDVTIKDWRIQMFSKLFPIILLMLIAAFLVFYIQKFKFMRKEIDSQEIIRKNQQLYKALFDSAPDGIATGNLQGIITKVNKSFTIITGYPENELIGIRMDALFSDSVLNKDPLDYKKILNWESIKKERELVKKDGEIVFGYKLTDSNQILFFVEDTGIGIPDTMHQKIFERFYRVHDAHESNFEGTGLGLSITKKLIELLNGKISVSSKPDKGSRFEFTINENITRS